MEQKTISFADFATRVMGETANGIFKAIDTITGKILFESDYKPYSTLDGADAFFKALYKYKKSELS